MRCRYGIVLDGQRGNRLHMFTREELLTQAVSFFLFKLIFKGTYICIILCEILSPISNE